uniref:Cationic amino acid transporter C-terminal domain-containing protein n=1 Tax=Romanomermis culicivorax TaxID=13658 RepID=A0A915HQU5_ROMCU
MTPNVFAVVNLLVIAFTVIYGLTFARKDYLTNPAYCQHNLTCSLNSEIVIDQCKASNAFMPFGFSGVVSGAAKVFFAYIGFDSIAAAGEETVKPQRTIPLATLLAMIIVTFAYVMMSLTLTMMVPYCTIVPDSAFATAFKDRGVYWAQYVVSVGALSGMTTVLFGSLFSTPRGVYAMSQDGLLCKFLSYVHPRTRTPIVGIVIFGVLTALMGLVFSLKILVEFVSIGTLMAYSIVACSVIVLRYEPNVARYGTKSQLLGIKDIQNKAGQLKARFKFCYPVTKNFKLNYVVSFLIVVIICLAATINFGSWYSLKWWSILVSVVLFLAFVSCLLFLFVHEQDPISIGFKMPFVPLFPAFSLLINVILMLRLSGHTWERFAAWLVLGLMIYFGYGMWNSAEGKLAKQSDEHAKDDIEMTRASKYAVNNS